MSGARRNGMPYSSSSGTSSAPNVRARCDRAWRWRWKASAGDVGIEDAADLFGLRGWGSARLANASSIGRAFWKSPRHSSAVPWQARPYAASAVMCSSAMSTRLAGGAPLSERQRAQRASPPSVQRTTGYALTLELGIAFLAGCHDVATCSAVADPVHIYARPPSRTIAAARQCLSSGEIANEAPGDVAPACRAGPVTLALLLKTRRRASSSSILCRQFISFVADCYRRGSEQDLRNWPQGAQAHRPDDSPR